MSEPASVVSSPGANHEEFSEVLRPTPGIRPLSSEPDCAKHARPVTQTSDLARPASLPPPQAYGRRLAIRLAVSLVVGGVFIWYMLRAGLRLSPRREDFAHVRWWVVGLYFASYSLVHYFRAYR